MWRSLLQALETSEGMETRAWYGGACRGNFDCAFTGMVFSFTDVILYIQPGFGWYGTAALDLESGRLLKE